MSPYVIRHAAPDVEFGIILQRLQGATPAADPSPARATASPREGGDGSLRAESANVRIRIASPLHQPGQSPVRPPMRKGG